MSVDDKRFTSSELKKYTGIDGEPIYVAYKEKIYEVTESKLWKGGKHMSIHRAGEDLTKSFENAPHGKEMLLRFPVIGTLAQEDIPPTSLAKRVASFHPHSIVVHFPIALSTVVPFFSILFLLTGSPQFEAASYYILLLSALSTPIGGLSGVFSWTVSYGARRSKNFRRKISLSVVLTLLTVILSVWRTLVPDVLLSKNSFSYVFFLVQLFLAVVAGALGHIGGMIIFS